MSTQVHCDQFRQEQYVPARQVRTMLSVYVASREERIANQGLGCAVKDLGSGEEKKLKISALTKMGVRFPNGKRVKAYTLRGGETYTMLCPPEQQNCGVFIVPSGTKYEYLYNGQALPPGSCIVWDGKKSKVVGYRLFRKLFIMSQNPVSAGKMKGAGNQPNYGAGQRQYGAEQQPNYGAEHQGFTSTGRVVNTAGYQQPQQSQQQRPVVNQPQNNGYTQAQHHTQQNSKFQFIAVGRMLHNGELVGLILTDGHKQAPILLAQCIAYAEKGALKNVKAVNRNGTKFLSGNGISLESLPYTQV